MAQKNRIIIYYQTLVDLIPLTKLIETNKNLLTDITLASIHFGTNTNNTPYIHLNDDDTDSEKFTKVYSQLSLIKKINKNIKINLLIGGAGTAFNTLFSNYDVYYNLLKTAIGEELNFINGFNLDIEEEVDINNIIKLVKNLKNDFPSKQIIFAPLSESIETDNSGMGGFSYKKLYNEIKDKIDYFNVQCYGEYSKELFNRMVSNGYPPDKIVMGMLTGQDLNPIIHEIENIVTNLNTKKPTNPFGGVAIWEYFNAPPSSPSHPYVWCEIMSHLLYEN